MESTLSTPDSKTTAAAQPAADPKAPTLRTDYHIWGTYFILVFFAVIELFSASIQHVTGANIFKPIQDHSYFLIGGLVAMVIMQYIHYKYLYRCIRIFVLGCLLLMVGVHFGGADAINDTHRAVVIPGTSISMLPADLLKLAVALGIANILTQFREKGTNDVTWTGFWLALGFLMVCAGMLFADGLSNTIIVLCIGISMFLVGGVSWKKLLVGFLLVACLGGGALALKMTSRPDEAKTAVQLRRAELNMEVGDTTQIMGSGRGSVWNERLRQHFRPDKHLEKFGDANIQEQLSYIAQAHGGVTGVGIGRSRENARLPLAQSDYIYAIIIEECGLLVGLFLLFTYMWLLGRSITLTMSFKQTMPGLLVMGCSFVIVFQALYHMAIVSGFFPVSGQPLPLISKGGTCVLATSLAFGVMLSCARHAVRVTDTNAQAKQERDILPQSAVSDNPSMIQIDDETK